MVKAFISWLFTFIHAISVLLFICIIITAIIYLWAIIILSVPLVFSLFILI